MECGRLLSVIRPKNIFWSSDQAIVAPETAAAVFRKRGDGIRRQPALPFKGR
jgi:hypothetical protein